MMLEMGVLNVAQLWDSMAPSLIALISPTPQVVAHGAGCLRLVAWSEVVSAIGVVLAGSFGGAGNTVPVMAVNLVSLWGLEVAIAIGLSRGLGWGATGVWLGRTLANLANGFLLAQWFRRGRWKRIDI